MLRCICGSAGEEALEPREHHVTHYDTNYAQFQTPLYEEIRREAFGEDIGQHSWLTMDEHNRVLRWLDLAPGKTLLDVGCGAGGPALRSAAVTGCAVVGIDAHEQAVATAQALAGRRGLNGVTRFLQADATQALPFPDGSFDAIVCIDALNHFPDRPRVIADWTRLLTIGGRMLFTNPAVVTGPLTNTEFTIRASFGFFLFVPAGYDERVIATEGLRLLAREDLTASTAVIAERRRTARATRFEAVKAIEGDEAYRAQQEFLATAARLARERRLSRFMFVAERKR
jgi:cyclopropane fatty-acyl-phospholipid synthase-like methyltransferase